MRFLALALIVVTVCVGDLLAEVLKLSADSRDGWSSASTIMLLFAGFYLWFKSDERVASHDEDEYRKAYERGYDWGRAEAQMDVHQEHIEERLRERREILDGLKQGKRTDA